MKLITQEVPNNFNLFLMGDVHTGARLSSQKAWEKFISAVQSPYKNVKKNIVVDHGDLIEAIMLDDPRFQQEATTESRVLQQMQEAVRMRWEIRKKFACILAGNHELTKHLLKFGDVVKSMADELNVPYGTYSAKIVYQDKKGRILFKHFATHGYGTMNMTAGSEEQRLANQRTKLKRQLRFKMGDTLLNTMGHTHRILTLPPVKKLYIFDNGKKLKQVYQAAPEQYEPGIIHEDLRWYANTGSFLRTFGVGFSSYSERFGYDPIQMGYCIATIRDRQITGIDEITL
jgi:hypothetical protein